MLAYQSQVGLNLLSDLNRYDELFFHVMYILAHFNGIEIRNLIRNLFNHAISFILQKFLHFINLVSFPVRRFVFVAASFFSPL
jgi:hypothetical protein